MIILENQFNVVNYTNEDIKTVTKYLLVIMN